MGRELEPDSVVIGGIVKGPNGELRGRLKGSRNMNTEILRKAQAEIEKQFGIVGFHPVTFMLMVAADDTEDKALRMQAAKSAAPYVIPALKSMELSGPNGGPVQTADVSELMAKAAKIAKLPLSEVLAGITQEEEIDEDEEPAMTPEREAAIEEARRLRAQSRFDRERAAREAQLKEDDDLLSGKPG